VTVFEKMKSERHDSGFGTVVEKEGVYLLEITRVEDIKLIYEAWSNNSPSNLMHIRDISEKLLVDYLCIVFPPRSEVSFWEKVLLKDFKETIKEPHDYFFGKVFFAKVGVKGMSLFYQENLMKSMLPNLAEEKKIKELFDIPSSTRNVLRDIVKELESN
jgi:hypothetical protein